MTTTTQTPTGRIAAHPIEQGVAALHDRLDGLVETCTWSMTPAELGDTLTALTRLRARVAELEMRIAVGCERADVRAADASTSTAVWWANQTRQTKKATTGLVRLAKALDWEREAVRDALAAGTIVLDQAQVIVHAVHALETGLAKELVEPDVVRRAEAELIRLAQEHDADALRILGRRILDIVAPEVGEAWEARLLAKQEDDALQAARFTLRFDPEGTAHGRFTLPEHVAAMLKKQLFSLLPTLPTDKTDQPDADAEPDSSADQPHREPFASPTRMGQAFQAWIERYPTDRLPTSGGLAATVAVTVDLDTLITGLGTATLDTGEPISPAQARSMACEAGIIPMVMSGKSTVLDAGRKQRFHSESMRTVIQVEQKHCTTVGCDMPPGLCHVHHPMPWAQGGVTSTKNARLMCPTHHHRAHDPDYGATIHPDGTISFHHRT